MLIEFRVENYRSIRDEQALTMEVGLLSDVEDDRPRTVKGHNKPLLPVAAIYGANASGKTNILTAMSFMQDAVLMSQRAWAPDEGIPRSAFAWGQKRSEPSVFIMTFLIERDRFEYGFVADDKTFLEEWLFAWPNGRKQMWFERENGKVAPGENLKGENRAIEGLTRPNSLFLSAAIQNGHKQLKPIHDWFRAIRKNNVPTSSGSVYKSPREFLEIADVLESDKAPNSFRDFEESTLARQLIGLIRSADLGIHDIRVEHESKKADDRVTKRSQFYFQQNADSTETWLPLSSQSQGTQTVFWIALPILKTLGEGGILIVDELEASLHPKLAAKIVRDFNNPKRNPKNAQLIFTTHDTNLLGNVAEEPLLRRDQVWFTEKDNEGATKLYPLTDYKPRKAENLERGYLQGRYGAIPFLGNLRFAGEEV